MSLAHRTPGLPGKECAVGIRLATLGLSAEAVYRKWPLTSRRFSKLYFRFWPGGNRRLKPTRRQSLRDLFR